MKIIPEPLFIEKREGNPLLFSKKITYEQSSMGDEIFADFRLFMKKFDCACKDATVFIKAFVDDRLEAEEYKLAVSASGVVITAKAAVGAFYALQTLKQLIVEYCCEIPACVIKDKPKFGYRAFMLDVGRYFYTVEDVKRYVDLMALHKLNYFHWHLTEDQGFRVEIKKYPELTIKGSIRSHTNFGFKPHSGFYTQEEIKEVVDYCHSRFIKVIPEFDIPGHCVAAISAYPYLGCFGRELKVATHWGVKHDILCVGKSQTYEFVKDVIDELCLLFPDEYFHMGGDEAVKTRWKICPDCQAKIKELGIADEDQLQQVFMSEIHQYLASKGKKSIMWNWDIKDNIDNLNKGIIWQYCGDMGEELIAKQINSGMKVIVSTCYANYLDLPFAWFNLEKTYRLATDNAQVAAKNKDRILGVEAPLWTEYVPNTKKADYLTFPRLGAVAECAWTCQDNKGMKKFNDKLDNYFKLLDIYGVQYAKRKQYMPSKPVAFCQSLWFNRRVLHWQGLHNLIDNAIVKIKYSKKK